MLALVASIHVFPQGSTVEDVDGRDKPDHDGKGAPFIETTSVASDGRARGFLAPQTWRATIIFLTSAIALAGFRPFGQALAQFMMVWQR